MHSAKKNFFFLRKRFTKFKITVQLNLHSQIFPIPKEGEEVSNFVLHFLRSSNSILLSIKIHCFYAGFQAVVLYVPIVFFFHSKEGCHRFQTKWQSRYTNFIVITTSVMHNSPMWLSIGYSNGKQKPVYQLANYTKIWSKVPKGKVSSLFCFPSQA